MSTGVLSGASWRAQTASVAGRRVSRCCVATAAATCAATSSPAPLAALLVPRGTAHASLAGVPPVTGLSATLVPLVADFLLGPSRILVLGPDSAVSPLVAAAIVPLAVAGDEARHIALADMLAILVGAIMFAGGLARFGFVTELMSMPCVSDTSWASP
jgi:Sulfate permease family